MRHFIHQFKKVEDPKWSVTETLYVAKFASNDIKSKVVYNKDGNWRYTVLQYKEKCLPGDIRKMVKSSYPDYTLTTIEEVHERNIVAYIVHLEDSKTVQIISICNGETKVWKAFNKSL